MEFKELTDLVQSAVAELHKAVERQDETIKKFGEASGEDKAAIEKINTALTDLMSQKEAHDKKVEDLEVKLQRQTIPGAVAVAGPEDENKVARKAAFLKFIRTGDDGDLRTLAASSPENRKALVENETGQYLITEEIDAEIVRELPKITVIRGLATVRTIGKDRIKMRSLGGVSVGWGKLETGIPPTESTLTPGTPTYQEVEDLVGLAKIGKDELMDSDFNLESILAEEFARALGEEEDKQFILGDGHDAEKPEGITKNAILTTAGNFVESTVAGAVTVEKFLELLYKCPTQFRRNGQFVVNSNTELLLRQLRAKTGDATYEGAFLWQPSVQAGLPPTFLGKPIHTQDDMSVLGDTALQMFAIFGDFKAGYRIVDRVGMTIQRITELYTEAGLVGFLVTKRVTGGVMRASQLPLVLMKEHAA